MQQIINGGCMQAKYQVSALEIQHRDTQQHLQTAQVAVTEQSRLLEQERAAIGQQTELVAIETLEANIHRAQEVWQNVQYTYLVPSSLLLVTSAIAEYTYRNGKKDAAQMLRQSNVGTHHINSTDRQQAKQNVFANECLQLQVAKFRLCMQANARMQQVLQRREAEANHTAMLDGVMRLVNDLNVELKQSGVL